jgi:hypothetical protein
MAAKRAQRKSRLPASQRTEGARLFPEAGQGGLTSYQVGVTLAVGFVFGVGVINELGPLNGLPAVTHWGWPWQDLGTLPMGLALSLPFLLIAGVLWGANRATNQMRTGRLLAMLAVGLFCMQLFSVLADPRGLERISQIVSSPDATGYFADALRIQYVRDWMSQFHHANLTGHARTHPAGPILFYYAFARLFGQDLGAFLGGCAVGLLASLGSVVMYSFTGLWTSDRHARLVAGAFFALLPGLTVFFPELDQIFPIFSMLIIYGFVRAVNASQTWYLYALAMGIAVFVATFFAYNLLAIGAFPLYYAIYWWWRQGRSRAATLTILRTAAAVLTISALLYLLLWATTGYNAPAALRRSLQAQEGVAERLGRFYRISVFADLYDFLLGTGIIAAPVLWFYFRKARKEFEVNPSGTALTLIALATVLTVNLSGLLRGETARVWLFLQPLVVVPVALQLARLRLSWRLAIFAMQWWLLVVIKAKMSFIEP